MGTRADFYIGIEPNTMEWIGSIAYDGFPNGWPELLLEQDIESKEGFVEAVLEIFEKTDHSTLRGQGWPWPWENSTLTDFSYAYDVASNQIMATDSFTPWHPFEDWDNRPESSDNFEYVVDFPDMSNLKNPPTLGSKRSGILAFKNGQIVNHD